MYYGFLGIAAFLFAAQFLFQQRYQRICGAAWTSTLTFTLLINLIGCALQLTLGGFRLEFTWYAMALAAAQATAGILGNAASIRALSTVNLAVYSMFSMLGGMVLPFAYGVLIGGESLTLSKVGCGLLIVVALWLTVKGERGVWRNTRYYWAVFVLNGMSGVIASIHQSNELLRVNSTSFMALTNLTAVAVSAALLMAKTHALPRLPLKPLGFACGYAAFTGIGNLLLLLALMHLPASVQYPIVTGGVIFFSTVVSALRREKITRITWISALLALASTVLIAL